MGSDLFFSSKNLATAGIATALLFLATYFAMRLQVNDSAMISAFALVAVLVSGGITETVEANEIERQVEAIRQQRAQNQRAHNA